MTFWHVTPTSNLKSILRRGLVPRDFCPDEDFNYYTREMTKHNVVFLADSMDTAVMNLDADWDKTRRGKRKYTLLRIDLPYDIPLEEDEFGLLYTHEPIPARYITVVDTQTAEDWVNPI